jgi:hypothetical protein
MKLQTSIPLDVAENQLNYQSQLLILGSCFAENIGEKLNYFKFQSVRNPFGILFHPLAIEKLLSKSIQKESFTEEDIFFLNEQWHCFDAHSDLSDPSKENLLRKLNTALGQTYKQIAKATHVCITLGTSWVYRKTETDAVVANCHKVVQKKFSKELLSVAQITESLDSSIETIRTINQNTQVVFTVSPVRHLKDGFIENQRSKSHLISAIHQIKGASYFPSYEIMMDELRDYRFYKTDMVHPSQLAIDYIWEKFKEVWISPQSYPMMEKVDTIQKGLLHRPFNASSEKHQLFLKSLGDKITYLKEEYPFMKFNK